MNLGHFCLSYNFVGCSTRFFLVSDGVALYFLHDFYLHFGDVPNEIFSPEFAEQFLLILFSSFA